MSAEQKAALEGLLMSDESPNVVVPFRPRDQVSRQITSFRSQPPEHPFTASAPMRIDGGVNVSNLLRGLNAAGLIFRHDARTGEFVICPDPEARS